MRTVLLTGKSGFVGRYLNHYLQDDCVLHTPNRAALLLGQPAKMKDYADAYPEIDTIIHCATLHRGDSECYEKNLSFYYSLRESFPSVTKFINFDSGASRDPNATDEYARSKAIIAKDVEEDPAGLNLRLYGCFGPNEKRSRFIPTCIDNALRGKNTDVHDMYFDYFYAQDVPIVVRHCLYNKTPKDIDLVYASSGMVTLSAIAREIYHLSPKDTGKPIVNSDRMPFYYCGDHTNLRSLDLKLNGLMNGIVDTTAHHFRQWMF